MIKSKHSNKTAKNSSTDRSKSMMNIQTSEVVAPEVSIEKESRTISTPVTNTIEKGSRKMISFTRVKNVLDIFTNSFIEYGRHLSIKYINENDDGQYERLMKNSYLRNVRFLLNPSWSDMNDDHDYPDYRTLDGVNSLFYMISEEKKNSWLFQPVSTFKDDSQLNDVTIFEAFEALINGVYHTEFMEANDESYMYFNYYFDMLKSVLNKKDNKYTQNIYHIGSLLQINDGVSSLNHQYTNLEACVATKNLVMAIHSLTTMKQNNIIKAIASMGLDESDIKEYVNCVLTPFFGVFYALRYLDMEDYINEIDINIYNHYCDTIPHESWIDEDEDFDEEAYRKDREETMKLQRAKRALEEEERQRIRDSIPVNFVSGQPEILNKRFVQKLAEEKVTNIASPTASVNSRASAFVTETASVKSSPTSSVSSHMNPLTYIPSDFVFEHDKIPKSMKRNDKKDVNGRDEGFLLFFAGTANDTVFERSAFSTSNGRCSIKEACRELPRLLVEKERLLRTSRNMIFGKTLEELYQSDIRNRTLYYTNIRRAIISFCNEISATSRNDNAARMEIIQRYYGVRRNGETERMYMNSFMFDVFRAFVNFYTFAKDR